MLDINLIPQFLGGRQKRCEWVVQIEHINITLLRGNFDFSVISIKSPSSLTRSDLGRPCLSQQGRETSKTMSTA